MTSRIITVSAALILGGLALGAAEQSAAQGQARVDRQGVYHVPSFAIPPSELASDEYKRRLIEYGKRVADLPLEALTLDLSTAAAILKARVSADAGRRKIAEEMQKIFPVTITSEIIGGVQTDVVRPKTQIMPRNKRRVLINLHGGGMALGARYEGQVGSIPIAALGGIEVITVDYRMAPEYRYPAAEEDVTKVYREILKRYPAENVGIYGCSAGAGLTARAIARFLSLGLPRPGAISLDGGGAVASRSGDSAYLAGGFLAGIPTYPPDPEKARQGPIIPLYLEGADIMSAAISPALHNEVLKEFPPTLVLNAMRDPTLSGAIYTHQRLVALGVSADLHVWEGMPHCFNYIPSLPESRENYDVLIKFFDRHLRR